MARPAIAVALHDVEPATFERCALIRDWLADHGIDRVTLLVIPARDLHPIHQRCPGIGDWLRECEQRGDAVAQHGFHHRRRRAEFAGLDGADTQRAVDTGRELLRLAGVDPRGFVAPAYAYTPHLREVVEQRFEWWAGLIGLHHHGGTVRHRPALPIVSPALMRIGSLAAGRVLRIDVHPADLDRSGQIHALEAILRRRNREPVTLADLAHAA